MKIITLVLVLLVTVYATSEKPVSKKVALSSKGAIKIIVHLLDSDWVKTK